MVDINNRRFLIKGVLGGVILLVLYFLILSLANSFSHAITRLTEMWYWILPLVVGFSIQIGLYFFVRERIRLQKTKNTTTAVGVSAGVSTGSMIACCAHHLIDILPILGLSAAFLFLSEYQTLFLVLGILSNIVAIIFMLEIIKKHSLYQPAGLLSRLAQFDIKAIRKWSMTASLLILLIVFLIIQNNTEHNVAAAPISDVLDISDTPESVLDNSASVKSLSSKINEGGQLSVEVEPINFSFNAQARFKVAFNTHQGNLDFDLTKKAVLLDMANNEYLPLEWQGGQGGHHLSGILIFPIIKKTGQIKLIINDIYNVSEREFLWNLDEI